MKRRDFNRITAVGAITALSGCSGAAPLRAADSLPKEEGKSGIIIHPFDSDLMKGR